METTQQNTPAILTVNAGSSSIKVAVFELHDPTAKILEASVVNIGTPSTAFVTAESNRAVAARNHAEAVRLLLEWLVAHVAVSALAAVGHRIVHGGPQYAEGVVVTDQVLADVRTLVAFDPQHLPVELELVEVFRQAAPSAQHVLCFDTAFHHNLPLRARLLPIPRRFETAGVRRYGFHGLSYAFIMQELRRVEGETAANGKVIIAHLGSGVSLAALQGGEPIDTTMSMTPASGVMMSTRSGDLDPSLALYFERTQGYDADRFNHMVNFESGLLGISETTADMEKLLEAQAADARARDAVDIFCYQVKKSIGSLAAALGGLNTLVFTGGMGEKAPVIRAKICDELAFLGITLDADRNRQSDRLISVEGGQVGVHVIRTDEATTIAGQVARLISA